MAGKKRIRKKRGSDFNIHVRLYRWMMKTPAWESLTVGPRALMVELYNLYDGSNNGQLFLSIRDAAKRLHVSLNTVSPWFDILMEKGFIKIAQRGAFSMKKRHATTWTLTEFAVGDDLPTKEFARWLPADGEAKPTTRRGGFRWNRATRRQGEIQNAVSSIDTDGIKDCVSSADLPAPKQASQYQSLTPSKPKPGAHSIKDYDTGKLPTGATSSDRSKPKISHPQTPSTTPAQENGTGALRRNIVSIARRK